MCWCSDVTVITWPALLATGLKQCCWTKAHKDWQYNNKSDTFCSGRSGRRLYYYDLGGSRAYNTLPRSSALSYCRYWELLAPAMHSHLKTSQPARDLELCCSSSFTSVARDKLEMYIYWHHLRIPVTEHLAVEQQVGNSIQTSGKMLSIHSNLKQDVSSSIQPSVRRLTTSYKLPVEGWQLHSNFRQEFRNSTQT